MARGGIHIEVMRDARREPIRLLTISREYGAGGSELGVLLGEKLGWLVIDHELVRRLAARLSCDEGDVVAMDEHAPSFLERLAAVATVTAPESRVHSTPWTTDPDCVAAAAREVLLETAAIVCFAADPMSYDSGWSRPSISEFSGWPGEPAPPPTARLPTSAAGTRTGSTISNATTRPT